MDVVVVTDNRFLRTPGGEIWTDSPTDHRFWRRYLVAFSRARVVARVHQRERVDAGWRRVDGEGVEVACMPSFHGALGFAHELPGYARRLLRAVPGDSAVILRAPGLFGPFLLGVLLRLRRRPYGVEVVGDPHDVFAPGSVRHPLRPVLRQFFTRELRRECARACAVAYVTPRVLMQRYPPDVSAFQTDYSSIELNDDAYVAAPRRAPVSGPPTVITVGSLNQMYKGTDVLIDAVARCVDEGLDLRLVIAGGGQHQRELQTRAQSRGLGSRAVFLGQLPGPEAVRAELDRADLFVLPSRAEGLPRAVIEAMARGLPCIGSNVGGIPDLLDPEDMVPPGDVHALARAIRDVLGAPGRMAAMSARNLERARGYHNELLAQRRQAFYEVVRARTADWLRARGRR